MASIGIASAYRFLRPKANAMCVLNCCCIVKMIECYASALYPARRLTFLANESMATPRTAPRMTHPTAMG